MSGTGPLTGIVYVEVPPEGITSGRETWGAAGESWVQWGSTRLTAEGTAADRVARWDALISQARKARWADERELVMQVAASEPVDMPEGVSRALWGNR